MKPRVAKRPKHRPTPRRNPFRRRLVAACVALVTSGVALPYAWQGMQATAHFFSALRDDVTALKVDQAQLQGQVTRIQKDLDLLLRHQLGNVAQGDGNTENMPRKDGTQ